MRVRILLLLLCISFATMISAQRMWKIGLPHGTQFIRINPTGLLDFVETNFSLGYEYHLTHNWSIAADATWIFYSKYFSHTKHANGFIFRPAIRRYTGPLKTGFLEAELHYKYVVSTIQDWLGRNCVGGVSAYEEFTKFDYLRKVIGFHLKVGHAAKLSKDNKFWFEYYIGLGARWTFRKVINEPNSCYIYASGPFSDAIENARTTIALPCGFRLLYNLRK